MPRIEEVGVLAGVGNNIYATLNTTVGRFHAGYRRGRFIVRTPDGGGQEFDAPGLAGGGCTWLDAEGGILVVYYLGFLGRLPGTETDNPDRPIRRLVTDIPCGGRVADTTVVATGPMGPMGPAGRDGATGATGPAGPKGADAVAISDADATKIAERVFNLPPAPDRFGLPKNAQFGTRFQEMISVMLWNQAPWQEWLGKLKEGWTNWRRGS